MNTDKKAVQVRFYITAEEQEALKRIKSRLGQSEAWILSTVTGSGLRAVDASGGSLPLPLKLGIQSELPIKPQPIRRAVRIFREPLKLSHWPQDVLRHTCASYSLAISQDFTRTAWQLGNSEKILLRHYYRVTDRETAEKFWSLLPTDQRQLEFFPAL